MLEVLYFASLREALGCDREQIDLSPGGLDSVASLKVQLISRGGAWSEVFGRKAGVLASVNHEMANDQTCLNDGDEVAFFPPVTGG